MKRSRGRSRSLGKEAAVGQLAQEATVESRYLEGIMMKEEYRHNKELAKSIRRVRRRQSPVCQLDRKANWWKMVKLRSGKLNVYLI